MARLSEGAWMATATVAEKELAILFDTMENWKEGQAQLLQQQLKMIKVMSKKLVRKAIEMIKKLAEEEDEEYESDDEDDYEEDDEDEESSEEEEPSFDAADDIAAEAYAEDELREMQVRARPFARIRYRAVH